MPRKRKLNPAGDEIRRQETAALALRKVQEAKLAAEIDVPETEVKPA